MKTLISAVFLSLSFSVMATETVVKTSILCQQEDGDQYFETGIVQVSPSSFRALVVEKNSDVDSAGQLLSNEIVYQKVQGNKTVFFNAKGTYTLTVYKRGSKLLGDLAALVNNGRQPIILKGLYCYQNSKISFEM